MQQHAFGVCNILICGWLVLFFIRFDRCRWQQSLVRHSFSLSLTLLLMDSLATRSQRQVNTLCSRSQMPMPQNRPKKKNRNENLVEVNSWLECQHTHSPRLCGDWWVILGVRCIRNTFQQIENYTHTTSNRRQPIGRFTLETRRATPCVLYFLYFLFVHSSIVVAHSALHRALRLIWSY